MSEKSDQKVPIFFSENNFLIYIFNLRPLMLFKISIRIMLGFLALKKSIIEE